MVLIPLERFLFLYIVLDLFGLLMHRVLELYARLNYIPSIFDGDWII